MTAETPAAPTMAGVLITWARTRPLELLPIVGLLIALITFAFVAGGAILGGAGDQLMKNVAANSFVLIWMLLATISVRTVGVRDTMVAFLSGIFLCTSLVYFTIRPLRNQISDEIFASSVIGPLVEEGIKLLPLLLILWAYHRRWNRDHGVSDLLVLGFAVGSGMGMAEDILYKRNIGELFTGSWGWIFPTFYERSPVSTEIFGIWAPSMPQITLVAHAGWGMIIGFGLGLASIYRRRPILAMGVAIGALALVIVDHSAYNFAVQQRTWFPRLLLDHNLLAFLIVLIIPLSIVYDSMRRNHRKPILPVPKLKLSWRAFRSEGDRFAGVTGLLAVGHYRRGWNALAYARASNEAVPDGRDDTQLLAVLGVSFPQAAEE